MYRIKLLFCFGTFLRSQLYNAFSGIRSNAIQFSSTRFLTAGLQLIVKYLRHMNLENVLNASSLLTCFQNNFCDFSQTILPKASNIMLGPLAILTIHVEHQLPAHPNCIVFQFYKCQTHISIQHSHQKDEHSLFQALCSSCRDIESSLFQRMQASQFFLP